MLNKKLKEEAIKNFKNTVSVYDVTVESVRKEAQNLFYLREKSGEEVIQPVEDYIKQLTNSPKEFDKSFSEYIEEFKVFNDLIEKFSADAVNTDFKAGVTAAAGVVAGTGTAVLMPTLTMAIATTFGTASTGTAIASLSGAAATNAALAWLGGGALIAGGGGMTTGSAFLSLAGPIGIGVGALGIIGSGFLASLNNKKFAQKVNQKREEVLTANTTLNASKLEINELSSLTQKHQKCVLKMLEELTGSTPSDYLDFDDEQKQKLGTLINLIKSLSVLINKKVA